MNGALGPLLCSSLQFFDRIKLFGMPAKHQPDLIYLRYVPLWKVHIFTLVQLTCLVLLWVIKASAAAVVFPMMVPAAVFTQQEHQSPPVHFVSAAFSNVEAYFLWRRVQVLALVFVRKLLDLFFTKRELSWLDDLMPESKKKKEDDKKKKEREKLVSEGEMRGDINHESRAANAQPDQRPLNDVLDN